MKATQNYRAHQEVCAVPHQPGEAWNDPCTCVHIRNRHRSIEHPGASVETPMGEGTCSGRRMAGHCMICDCARFERAT